MHKHHFGAPPLSARLTVTKVGWLGLPSRPQLNTSFLSATTSRYLPTAHGEFALSFITLRYLSLARGLNVFGFLLIALGAAVVFCA
jgi:hypothetical protein